MASQPEPTELRRRERMLRRAYQVLASTDSFTGTVDALFELLREELGTGFATLSRVHEDADEYVFERVLAPDGVDLQPGDRTALSSLPNCARVVERAETLVCHDVGAVAPELSDPEWGIECYLGAPVVVDGEVYGTFCFYDVDARSEAFSQWDVTVVDMLSRWVSQEITRQRYVDRVTALNELNGIVRDVTASVVDQPTREAVESVACERLAASDSFLCAWIGAADPETGRLRVRAEAGVDAIVDGMSLALSDADDDTGGDADDDTGGDADDATLSPPVRALRTDAVQTRQHATVGPSDDKWAAHARRHGYGSLASVPVVDGGSPYGVLTVHAERPYGFVGEEGKAVIHLGEMLGHAIAAAEREQALTGDTVVELTLSIRNALADCGVRDPPTEPVLLHDFVRVDDGVLAFGSATEAGRSEVRDLADTLPNCESVAVADGEVDVAFEAEFSAFPLLSQVTALGGRVDDFLLDGGDVRATAYFSPEVEFGRVVDALTERYQSADVVSKRETVRPDESTGPVGESVTADLTDRQREALRTAYLAGYFERPRETTGEEVADRLGVSNSTFSQHLRAAQGKVFGHVFDDTTDE